MTIDFSQVAQAALSAYPDLLHRWLPGGKLHGHEFKAGSLQGDAGESLSINTRSGKWADFATGDKGGDAISLYAAIHRCGQADAARQLADLLGVSNTETTTQTAAKPREVSARQIIPAPDSPPDIRHRLGKPVATWAYKTQAGELIGYIHRFNKSDGKKEIIPQIYAETETGVQKWVWKSFGDPRPLYNLPALNNAAATVLLVEGEKCADHAANLLPECAVLTWPGGSKAIIKADFSPLAGRKVMLFPDHDAPGFDAMNKIAGVLRSIGCSVRFVVPPVDTPEGWDIADSNWNTEQARAFIKSALSEKLPEYITAETPPEQIPFPDEIPDAPPPADHQPAPHVLNDAPFRCLGYDKENYFYFCGGRQIVVKLTASQHTKANLMALADYNYWCMEFPKGKGGDFDLEAAVNAMLRLCERRGMFEASKVRGRGAWWDEGRVIVHLGDRVITGGEIYSPAKAPSRFVYEAGFPMRADFTRPLSNKEAHGFLELMQMLPWERPIQSRLAAGWCVVAHICGAMKWRPHIWVVGRKGSGKTYVMSNIIRPILGDNHFFFQGASSEAGIRQRLKGDALPVLFDEADGEDQAANNNIQRVLQLVRQSSSDTGGTIAKGTPSGLALNYTIRSCFAFSSINANIVQQSDKSRLTVLELNQDYRKHEFIDISRAEAALLTDDYIQRFYARAVSLAAIIRDNAMTFARAAAAVFGEQRAGDQIGALLAGAYSLHSDKIITLEQAISWVNAQDWSEQKEEIAGQSDERQLLSFLMQQKLRVNLSHGGSDDLPVGLLVDIAMGNRLDFSGVNAERAGEYLTRHGMKLSNDDTLYIANSNPQLEKILANTPWAKNWGRVLRRLPGAQAVGPTYFGFKGSESRAVEIILE